MAYGAKNLRSWQLIINQLLYLLLLCLLTYILVSRIFNVSWVFYKIKISDITFSNIYGCLQTIIKVMYSHTQAQT